ncbi:MAG: GDP-mannose 4,6-dehydratase, partial [Pseudobdellovibrionaceae bacterium]
LAEQKLQQIAEHLDLQVIVLRLFNHTHKSQGPGFFLPSLHQQILNAEEKIKTGNLNIVRDLGALQDLLQAFTAIVESVTFSSAGSRNHTTPAPEKFLVYNICSGHGKNLSLVAEELSKQLGKKVEFEVDPSRSRPNEPFSIVGSSKKFQHDFAWVPHHAMNEVELVKSFLQNI